MYLFYVLPQAFDDFIFNCSDCSTCLLYNKFMFIYLHHAIFLLFLDSPINSRSFHIVIILVFYFSIHVAPLPFYLLYSLIRGCCPTLGRLEPISETSHLEDLGYGLGSILESEEHHLYLSVN